ncbi:MAG: hypothetical protein ABW026_18920 [Microvirga sp.]
MADGRKTVFIGLVYYRDYLDGFAGAYRKLQRCSRFSDTCIVINGDGIAEADVRQAFGPLQENLHVLKHDNRGQEFGGYQAGLDFHRLGSDDAFDLVLANDTLGEHQKLFTAEFDAFRKTLAANPSGKVVGKIDHAQRLQSIGPLTSSRWVRSNLMGLDHEALAKLRFRIYVPELEALVNETDRESEFFSAEVGQTVQDRLRKWLFRPETHSWYGASRLDGGNAGRFAAKARSILQEIHLSMRLNCEGMAFIAPRMSRSEQRMIRVQRKVLSLGSLFARTSRAA